jgi:hypothetical protein
MANATCESIGSPRGLAEREAAEGAREHVAAKEIEEARRETTRRDREQSSFGRQSGCFRRESVCFRRESPSARTPPLARQVNQRAQGRA